MGQLANAAGYKSEDTAAKGVTKAGALIADHPAIEIVDGGAPNNESAVRVPGFWNFLGEDVRWYGSCTRNYAMPKGWRLESPCSCPIA